LRGYQRGGLKLLVRNVTARSRQPGANLYLIADGQGRILSGNVESLEPGVLDRKAGLRGHSHIAASARRSAALARR
jgi:hypothetical protein